MGGSGGSGAQGGSGASGGSGGADCAPADPVPRTSGPTCGAPAAGPRRVGYLPTYRGSFASWAEALDFGRLTHLVVAFGSPAADGTVSLPEQSDADLDALVGAAHACNVKVLLSFGGGADTTGAEIRELITPAKVQGFAAKIAEYVAAHALDGVDVDLEGNSVNENYGGFVDALSTVLAPEGKLLTAALGTWFAERIPADALSKFDFVSAMAYDEHGTWTDPGEHSTYELAATQAEFWSTTRGVPADKLVIGVPFYGYYWGATNEALTYAEILARFPDACGRDWIEGDGFSLSYNGPATIRRKAELSKSYGGTMIWELGQDAAGTRSLLSVIDEALRD